MSTDTWFTFFALLTVATNIATLALWVLAVASSHAADAPQSDGTTVRATLGDVGLPLAPSSRPSRWPARSTSPRARTSSRARCAGTSASRMYSLAVVLVVAAVRRDWTVRPFALALVTRRAGGLDLPLPRYSGSRARRSATAACDPTNPCTITLIWKFHYISIPFMALSAFALVATCPVAWPADPDEARPPTARHATMVGDG